MVADETADCPGIRSTKCGHVKQREDAVYLTPWTREDQSGLIHGPSAVGEQDNTSPPAECDSEPALQDNYEWLQEWEGRDYERLPEVRIENSECLIRELLVGPGCRDSKRDLCECAKKVHEPQHDAENVPARAALRLRRGCPVFGPRLFSSHLTHIFTLESRYDRHTGRNPSVRAVRL